MNTPCTAACCAAAGRFLHAHQFAQLRLRCCMLGCLHIISCAGCIATPPSLLVHQLAQLHLRCCKLGTALTAPPCFISLCSFFFVSWHLYFALPCGTTGAECQAPKAVKGAFQVICLLLEKNRPFLEVLSDNSGGILLRQCASGLVSGQQCPVL